MISSLTVIDYSALKMGCNRQEMNKNLISVCELVGPICHSQKKDVRPDYMGRGGPMVKRA